MKSPYSLSCFVINFHSNLQNKWIGSKEEIVFKNYLSTDKWIKRHGGSYRTTKNSPTFSFQFCTVCKHEKQYFKAFLSNVCLEIEQLIHLKGSTKLTKERRNCAYTSEV